jgi:hypothetical protein
VLPGPKKRLSALQAIFHAVARRHKFRGETIHFAFKLQSQDKKSWTKHHGLYILKTDKVRECDKNGIVQKNCSDFNSVWEMVKEKHWSKKGQSCVPWIHFFGHSAAAFISKGINLVCSARFVRKVLIFVFEFFRISDRRERGFQFHCHPGTDEVASRLS